MAPNNQMSRPLHTQGPRSPSVDVVEEFMANMADARSDAGIDYRLEKDGSISHRSEDGAAVQRVGDEVMKARLQSGLKLRTECVGD